MGRPRQKNLTRWRSCHRTGRKVIFVTSGYWLYCALFLFLFFFGEAVVSVTSVLQQALTLLWDFPLAADVREQQEWGCPTRKEESGAEGDQSTVHTSLTRAQSHSTWTVVTVAGFTGSPRESKTMNQMQRSSRKSILEIRLQTIRLEHLILSDQVSFRSLLTDQKINRVQQWCMPFYTGRTSIYSLKITVKHLETSDVHWVIWRYPSSLCS